MSMRSIARAVADRRSLLAGLALGLAMAYAAPAYAQDGGDTAQTAAEDTDFSVSADPAAAGDVDLTMDQVQAFQEALKDLGYFYGPADGRKGPRTRTALRLFQTDQKLPVTGSFDRATVRRIADQAKVARVEHRPVPPRREKTAEPAAQPNEVASTTDTPAPVERRDDSGGGDGVWDKTTGAVKTGVGAGIGAIGTAGKATGRAGEVAGTSTAKAGVVTANASVTAAKAVAKSGVFVWDQGRRAVVGDRKTDDDIRRAILRQYADSDRIVPDEIDVHVTDGNVTLQMPENARSDVPHAVRLARLTAGVKSVTSVTTSVNSSDDAQPGTN